MGITKERWSTRSLARRFVLHSVLLSVALMAVCVFAGPYLFFPLAAVVCLFYVVLPFLSHRELWKKDGRNSKARKLLTACALAGMAGGLALNTSAPLMWLSGAYRWDDLGAVYGVSFQSTAAMVIEGDYSYKVGGSVVLLLLSALLLGLALAIRPYVQKTELGGCETELCGLGARSILSFWLFGFVTVEFIELLLILSRSGTQFFTVLDEMTLDGAPAKWELFSFYPALPVGIAVAGTIVVTLRDVIYQFDLPTDRRAISQDGRAEGTPVRLVGVRVPGFAVAALAGFIAVAGVYICYAHVGLVAMAASVRALVTGRLAGKSLERWIAEQRDAGRTEHEIVTAINESGYWSPDAPEQGLAKLLPASGKEQDDISAHWACPIAVAAGPISPTGPDAGPWPGMSTLPTAPIESGRKREEHGHVLAADSAEAIAQTPPPVRYCLKAACPSPVAWQAPDAIALYSSHPSTVAGWMHLVYFDFFAEGRAAAPGGYCTETGELAASYQG